MFWVICFQRASICFVWGFGFSYFFSFYNVCISNHMEYETLTGELALIRAFRQRTRVAAPTSC